MDGDQGRGARTILRGHRPLPDGHRNGNGNGASHEPDRGSKEAHK
jgi:hypothetical protein